MHENALPIDVDTARRLIREQFPQFANDPIEPLVTIGTDHAIFRIGSGAAARFALRTRGPSEDADALCREVAAMTEIAIYSPVPTPVLIGVGSPGLSHARQWIVQSWVDGVVATPDGLCRSDSFARDLAHLVKSLRRADVRGRRFDGRGRGGHLPDHDRWLATCFARSEPLLDVPRLRQLWARLRELPAPDTMVMSHRDLIPANLLVDGDRLVGVLDCGGFGPADPALDLVAGWHLLDASRRALFRSEVGAGDLEWQRGAAWALQQAMGLVWYYDQSNPAMSALGRSTLDRIVAASEI